MAKLVTEEWVQSIIKSHSVIRRIACAANRNKDGVVVCSARHYDPRMVLQMEQMGGTKLWVNSEQGFIDQWGLFHTREQAWVIAKAAGQIIRIVGSQHPDDEVAQLFSENLY